MDTKQVSKKEEAKAELPEIRPGQTIRVHSQVKEGDKERIQVFEGTVIACHGGRGLNATFTVRKISEGIGVEKIYPLHSPRIVKLDILKHGRVRRAKLYYLRDKQLDQLKEETRPVK